MIGSQQESATRTSGYSFVATGVVQPALLLRALVASTEKWEFGSAARAQAARALFVNQYATPA
jgi:hypothetical protein